MKKLTLAALFLLITAQAQALEAVPLSSGQSIIIGSYQVSCNQGGTSRRGEIQCTYGTMSNHFRSDWHSDRQTSINEAGERCENNTRSRDICVFKGCEER